jgi:hypothetical protein
LRRLKGDGEAAAAHVARIVDSDEFRGATIARFVEGRLDGSLMDGNREAIARYVADGNVREETDCREFLANELTTVIEVSRGCRVVPPVVARLHNGARARRLSGC